MPQFIPPDHAKGDDRTVGGYAAVHGRPAAFAGADGASYSVEIEVEETGDASRDVGGYLVFVRWSPGEPRVTGHLETDFLARGTNPDDVRRDVGSLTLDEVKRLLDSLIVARQSAPGRPWWESMRDE